MLKSIIKNNYKFCLSILIYIISKLYLSINKSYDLLSLLLLNTLFFIPLFILNQRIKNIKTVSII